MKATIRILQEALKERKTVALCIVVETGGSTPAKAGARMIVRSDGTSCGTVGGGALEQAVTAQALQVMHDGAPALFHHRLVKDRGMCCGGNVTVYIEPVRPPHRLYIFGAGHVGRALAEHAAPLDFDITAVDDRCEAFEGWNTAQATCLQADPAEAVTEVTWDERTFAVIMTYDHRLDRKILARCLKHPAGYLGMIGSRRKAAVTRKLFIRNGVATTEELDRVDMPVGPDIGSQTPHEIAVSILCRLILVRNRHGIGTQLHRHMPEYTPGGGDTEQCTR